MLLAGKVAVISGAASPRGIGLATARLFAAQGARVAILDLDEAAARLRTAGDRRLGEALQDQRLVAGIGNMWMAEALWTIGVSPWTAVRDASDATLRDAVAAARRLMQDSLASNRPARKVYRRAGRPCGRCGTIVRSRGQGDANRTAYWCPGCQCQAGGGPPGE